MHSATQQNLLLHSCPVSVGDPTHFNLDPVPRVAGDRYNVKEWLGRSVVLSVADFVKVKDPPLVNCICVNQ